MNDNILVLLEQQSDNFPLLTAFIYEKNLNPATLFLPQTIKGSAEEITRDPLLLIECFNYLDIVKIYSFIIYDDSEKFTKSILEIITSNRVVENTKYIIDEGSLDDFIFSAKDEMLKFIDSNKFLLSLYIFATINYSFYKQKNVGSNNQ